MLAPQACLPISVGTQAVLKMVGVVAVVAVVQQVNHAYYHFAMGIPSGVGAVLTPWLYSGQEGNADGDMAAQRNFEHPVA